MTDKEHGRGEAMEPHEEGLGDFARGGCQLVVAGACHSRACQQAVERSNGNRDTVGLERYLKLSETGRGPKRGECNAETSITPEANDG